METLLQDIRYSIRVLFKNLSFTAIAVIALALGIGANTAIFSVVNAVLLRPLPYKNPESLVMVWEKNIPRNRERNVVAPADFLDWNSQNTVFEQMAAASNVNINLTGVGEPEELAAQFVTASLFPMLGVNPLHGRTFSDEEDQPNGPYVAVLSHRLWQRRFGADPNLVGNTITLNGRSYTVVGVMPAGFHFINKATDVWMPMGFNLGRDYRAAAGRFLISAARLRPGVSIEQARAEMVAIAARLEQTYPDYNAGWSVNVIPLQEQVVGEIRPALLVLLGAVAFVLLIACANVANLLLARAASREKEFAVRTALGARRGRLVRQLLTESTLLGLMGGLLGLVLAYWGIELLTALSPKNVPRLEEISIDARVLGFTLGVSMLTGIIFGLVPALQASKADLNETLKEGGRSAASGGRSHRLRALFVVSEVALALVLLIGAGLMIRSFVALQRVEAGFNPENLMTMKVLLPASKYQQGPQRTAFFEQALRRLEAIPGVQSTGMISFLPLDGLGSATSFKIVGRPEPAPGESPTTAVSVIDRNYFAAMGIPLIKGRLFTERDGAQGMPRTLIINETMARRFFPDEDPIGKQLIISWDRPALPDEIIGVVGDVKDQTLDGEPRPAIYWPHARYPYSYMAVLARTSSDPHLLARAMQNEIRAVDPDQPVSEMRTMEEVMGESIWKPRFNMLLLSVFAIVALILAAVGIYGVMSYSVTQRTHEIGIRMALGARPLDVVGLILGQGLRLVLAGIAIGLVSAYILTGVLASLLFGVSTTDPVTFAAISLLLAAIAMLANYIPARRATKVDPMIALRYE